MNALLCDLALRGSLVTALVLLLDLAFGARQPTRWRRVSYVLLVLAWIVPLRLPSASKLPIVAVPAVLQRLSQPIAPTGSPHASQAQNSLSILTRKIWVLWLAGAFVNLCVVGISTARTARRWSRVRLCTNAELLELLEDCKSSAGVVAPVALVSSHDVSTPALLGWIRPRILLPTGLIDTLPREQLRAVLLHELAHFRAADIPLQWLFCFAQSLHWFNPLVYLASHRWKQFREVSADEAALRWMPQDPPFAYAEALIAAIRQANPTSIPRGALALGESVKQLKLRMTMITRAPNRPRSPWSAILANILLACFIALPAASFADAVSPGESAKSAAQVASTAWLKSIDDGDFAASWTDASSYFKAQLTQETWAQALQKARQPAGKFVQRSLKSSLYQTEVPGPNGEALKGEFVIQQFDSTFANLNAAREVATFTKDTDGQWRAAGYFIMRR